MKSNRRNFLQQIGLAASLTGIELSMPSITAAKTSGDNKTSIEASASTAVAETTAGKVRGYVRNGIFTYKGIPYGAATEGANRFMPPVKPAPWTGIRNTLVYGPISPQKPNTGWSQIEYAFLYQWKDGVQGEDCLRLNVWTPGINDARKRPVLFWIHGGGFTSGSGQEHPSYDGENLSRLGDVVVVSINHRLNHFGFLDLSVYGEPYRASANAGMLDIVAALEWVRDNITNFGGDGANVTIFGQSGGGTKVITLMAMPAAKGLFHKAVVQSNSIVQVSVPAYAQQLTEHFLKALHINGSNITELHTRPVASLIETGMAAEKAMGGVIPAGVGRPGWQPVVDGSILPAHPFDPVAPALSAHIPFLVGTTRNEASASIGNAAMEAISEGDMKQKIMTKYPAKGALLYEALRKAHPDVKPVEVLSYLSAQNAMAYLKAERKAAQAAAPVYLYMFSWQTKMLDGRPRSFHCSEIPFVFNNTDVCDTYTGATAEARRLSQKMAKAWITFARTGNPSHKDLPAWPAFTEENGAMMNFDNNCTVRHDPDDEGRKLLQRIFYNKET